MIIITNEYLLKYRTNKHGWTKDQFIALGLGDVLGKYSSPPKGWKKRVIGQILSDEQAKRFQAQVYTNPNKHKKITRKTKRKIRKNETFYGSKAWRELRYEALKLYGRACACCGAKPPDIVLHVDHIKPRSLYPDLELAIDNLQILCKDCNLGKSNKDCIDYRGNI